MATQASNPPAPFFSSTKPTSRSQADRSKKPPTFLTLPPELHRLIARELKYPDMLSLKLSHPYFQAVLDLELTIYSRVEWVVSRAEMGLHIPQSTGVSFRSDAAFVANPEVKSILKKRLRHYECLESKSARDLAIKTLGQQRGRTFCFVVEAGSCPRIKMTEGTQQQQRNRGWSRTAGNLIMELLGTWMYYALALLVYWIMNT